MALTREVLAAEGTLQGLTEEQIASIVAMSENDENTVMGKRFGEVYREMDSSIEANTGIKRNGDEKTYNYLARATKEYAGKFADYEEVKKQNAELTQKNTDLEKRIAEGGDEALRSQNEALVKELASTKSQFVDLKDKLEQSEAKHAEDMNNYRIDSEIARAQSELKLKQGLNEEVKKAMIDRAVANIKAKNPSFDDAQRLVFHDENGAPLNNSENSLNPYTAKELLAKEYERMDLLEVKPSRGAGARGNAPRGGFLTASTQTEAMEMVGKNLTDKGFIRGSQEFQEEMNRLWAEGGYSQLPLR